MVAGMDRYFQIVKCFRDEDLRADRQPEFSQIDCEMAFVTREDILNTFEGLTKHLYKELNGITLPDFPACPTTMPCACMAPTSRTCASTWPSKSLTTSARAGVLASSTGPSSSPASAPRGGRPVVQQGAQRPHRLGEAPPDRRPGSVYVRFNTDGTIKSTVGKFFDDEALRGWGERSVPARATSSWCSAERRTRYASSSGNCVWRWAAASV